MKTKHKILHILTITLLTPIAILLTIPLLALTILLTIISLPIGLLTNTLELLQDLAQPNPNPHHKLTRKINQKLKRKKHWTLTQDPLLHHILTQLKTPHTHIPENYPIHQHQQHATKITLLTLHGHNIHIYPLQNIINHTTNQPKTIDLTHPQSLQQLQQTLQQPQTNIHEYQDN